jgi:hypothetical protein
MADREWLAQEPMKPRIVQRTQRDSTEPRANPGAAGGVHGLLRLQRSVGNRAFGRVLMLARLGQGLPEVQPEVEQAIQAARGGGQALDHGVRGHMEQAMSADFSEVRIHAGSQADVLNRNLSARAFTTGQDIFFKQGEYSPGSSGGQELLAHELTHVMQQNDGVRRAKAPDEEPEEETGGKVMAKAIQAKPDAVQRAKAPDEEPEEETGGKVMAKAIRAKPDTVQRGMAPDEEPGEETSGKVLAKPIQAKLTVGAADDQYEQEADRTAGQVMRALRQGAQRQPERDEDKDKLQAKFGADQVERPSQEVNDEQVLRTDPETRNLCTIKSPSAPTHSVTTYAPYHPDTQRMAVEGNPVASVLSPATAAKHVAAPPDQDAAAQAGYGHRTFVAIGNLITAAVDAHNHDFPQMPLRSNRFDFTADVVISQYEKQPPFPQGMGLNQPVVQTINQTATLCEIGVVKNGNGIIQVTHFKKV